ncbi:MAG: (d)CMP kinase [Solirubrobacteraceae bacterium]
MIIAIEGPAGAGKSSTARAAAERLGFTYLDSGALYRCVALVARERGEAPAAVAPALTIQLGERVTVDGRDVTAAIRSAEVSRGASEAAADPDVRAALLPKQQELLGDGDWVAEGRDIGTGVAPGAEVKVFLTASPDERARRRAAEMGVDPAEVLADQTAREERDTSRSEAPLRAAADAVHLDTTGLSRDEVVEQIVALATKARS